VLPLELAVVTKGDALHCFNNQLAKGQIESLRTAAMAQLIQFFTGNPIHMNLAIVSNPPALRWQRCRPL
jgi:hypothetical protein